MAPTKTRIPAVTHRTARPESLSGSCSRALAVINRRIGGVPVVVADGDIDLATTPTLAQHLETNLTGPHPPPIVVVDLQHVSFLSATGLDLLAAADQQATAQHTQLRIIANTHAVVRALMITGLHDTLAVYPTEPAALTT